MRYSDRKEKAIPFIIIRLWPHHHTFETDLNELLAALKANRQACDEVWFCTEWGFPPMDAHERSARLMADAADAIRSLGIEPGIQIANTFGHGMSLLQDDSGAAWPMMVGPDGLASSTAPCPRSDAGLDYIDQMTRTYAAWKPSSIWIDDDLRMSHHGSVKFGCFCPVCLKHFSTQQKRKYNLKSLVSALHKPEDGSVRLAWTRFNAESLAGIACVIAKAAHSVAPGCRLGFQQLGHEQFLYSGPDWNPLLKSLAKYSHKPAGARLGHGCYTDHSPRQMMNKAFLIGRQIARLPDCVDQICPEIEGFTHNAFGKSAHGLVVESSLDIAMGCNSLSYAILCSGHEPMDWYETLLSRIATYRPFWKKLVCINANTRPGGLDIRLGMEHVARRLQPQEQPFAWTSVNLDSIYNLASLGLPLSASESGDDPVILHADVVAGLSDKELRRILSGGVVMDGLAALRIQERGLGKSLGVNVERIGQPWPYRERLSDNALNGIFANREWNASNNAAGAFMLNPLSTRVQSLGLYTDLHGKAHGIATSLAENKSGGRVAVFGYCGWENAPSGAKRNQYLAAADWVSRQTLPVICQTIAQVMVAPRLRPDGKLASVFLLNASIDSTTPLELRLRGVGRQKASWLTPENADRKLALIPDGKDYLGKTPPMRPWSVACIAFQ